MTAKEPRHLTVRANGIRQHLIRHAGPGPQMLLIPGITSPAITWGFVAERPEFADLCARLGIVFIGPSADVMRPAGPEMDTAIRRWGASTGTATQRTPSSRSSSSTL